MANHREVSVALCGVLVGAMIGAATFITTGDSLTAKTTRGGPTGRAELIQKILRERNKPVTAGTASTATRKAPTPVVQPSNCDAVRGFASDVRAKAETIFEGSKLEALTAYLDVRTTQICNGEGTHAAAGAEAASPAVGKNCDQYPRNTARYTNCVREEQSGITN